MADKEKDSELTPWQKQHAAFEKQKAAEAAKKAREEKKRKHATTITSVVDKYDAISKTTPATPSVMQAFSNKIKGLLKPSKKDQVLTVFIKMWPFLLVAMLGVLGSVYVLSPLSKIGSFHTAGNSHESTKQIADSTGIKTDDYIWRIIKSKKEISKKISKTFPRIKTAAISFSFPNNFSAKITEYGDSVYLKTGDVYQIVLSDGNIVTDEHVDAGKLSALPILDGFSEKEAKLFVKGYETLNEKIKKQIVSVSKTPTKVTSDFVAIEMKDSNQVRVPLSQIEDKLPYYTSVAKELTEPSVIDMEAGVYAKSKTAYQQDLDDEANADAKNVQKTTTEEDSDTKTQDKTESSTTTE